MGQITVFSAPERRRRWSEEDRARILTEAFSPDACVAEVARRHDFSTAQIYTREALAIHVDQGIKGEQVVDVMDRLLFQRGKLPDKIRVDNVLCWEAAAATGQQISLRRSGSALLFF